jgi:hypothetical protein
MDENLCIRLAEKIVAAKGELNNAQAERHVMSLSLRKQKLFVVSDETPEYYKDSFSGGFLRYKQEYWYKQFYLNPEAIEAISPIIMKAHDERVKKAQEALNELLEASHVSD